MRLSTSCSSTTQQRMGQGIRRVQHATIPLTGLYMTRCVGATVPMVTATPVQQRQVGQADVSGGTPSSTRPLGTPRWLVVAVLLLVLLALRHSSAPKVLVNLWRCSSGKPVNRHTGPVLSLPRRLLRVLLLILAVRPAAMVRMRRQLCTKSHARHRRVARGPVLQPSKVGAAGQRPGAVPLCLGASPSARPHHLAL